MDAATPNTQGSRLVCFRIGGQEFGVAIDSVKETLTWRPVTRVFLTPAWVLGIINLRGDIVALLDLAQLLGMPPTAFTEDSRIIILLHDGVRTGIVVDELLELRSLPEQELSMTPSTLAAEAAELIAGLATGEDGSALRVLNLGALMESERITSLSRARE